MVRFGVLKSFLGGHVPGTGFEPPRGVTAKRDTAARVAEWEVGSWSLVLVTNRFQDSSNANNHRRNHSNVIEARARFWGCSPLPPRYLPPGKQRGHGPGAHGCSRRLQKEGDTAEISPPHCMAFQLVFSFLLFPLQFRPRNSVSALHSKPPSDGAVRVAFRV